MIIKPRLIATVIAFSVPFVLGAEEGNARNFTPVKNFSLERYLGTWYEIVRMPVIFENGLIKVTATYSLNEKGGVAVTNKGIKEKNGKESTAKGKAKFGADKTTGYLKVSFFGPFYADYVIVELDTAYTYAMVAGDSNKYLWILSRTPTMDKPLLDKLIQKAANKGYNTGQLIYTIQQ